MDVSCDIASSSASAAAAAEKEFSDDGYMDDLFGTIGMDSGRSVIDNCFENVNCFSDCSHVGAVVMCDDLGDFIDTDIPRNCYASSTVSSKSVDSATSSYEDLSLLVVEGNQLNKSKPTTTEFPDLMTNNVECSIDVTCPVQHVNNLSQNDVADEHVVVRPKVLQFGVSDEMRHNVCENEEELPINDPEKSLRNQLLSTNTAGSTSESSFGTPSALLASPFLGEEDPHTFFGLESPGDVYNGDLLLYGNIWSNDNLSRNKESLSLSGMSVESTLLSFSCQTCNGILDNINLQNSKHHIEKHVDWKAENISVAALLSGKHPPAKNSSQSGQQNPVASSSFDKQNGCSCRNKTRMPSESHHCTSSKCNIMVESSRTQNLTNSPSEDWKLSQKNCLSRTVNSKNVLVRTAAHNTTSVILGMLET